MRDHVTGSVSHEGVCHTPYDYFDLNLKSPAQKLAEKFGFFIKLMYVTICDIHGHHRSQVMV